MTSQDPSDALEVVHDVQHLKTSFCQHLLPHGQRILNRPLHDLFFVLTPFWSQDFGATPSHPPLAQYAYYVLSRTHTPLVLTLTLPLTLYLTPLAYILCFVSSPRR